MDDKSVLDFNDDQSIVLEKLNRSEKTLTIIVVSFIVINTLLYCASTSYRGSGFLQDFMISVGINVFLITFLAATLGLVVALLPYQGLVYSMKYQRSFLLTNSVIHFVQFIGLLSISIFS
jgi:hypothetical protein